MRKRPLYSTVLFVFIFAFAAIYYTQLHSKHGAAASSADLSSVTPNWRNWQPPSQRPKHAVMIHLDGFQADIFKKMIPRLPHFKLLLTRGKITYDATTVDKSETFKVIESYLTSRRDTYITGWWQYSRKTEDFRNYWIDPEQVLNYALGTEFPLYPTILDFVNSHHQTVISGFGLHRRGVKFENYGRVYYEGLMAALGAHTYFKQCDATMTSVLNIYRRLATGETESGTSNSQNLAMQVVNSGIKTAKSAANGILNITGINSGIHFVKKILGETSQTPVIVADLPQLNFTVLAPADEYGHLEGTIETLPARLKNISENGGDFCIARDGGTKTENNKYEKWFQIIDEEHNDLLQYGVSPNALAFKNYFTKTEFDPLTTKSTGFCFTVPKMEGHFTPIEDVEKSPASSIANQPESQYIQPDYILGMMMVDYQIGRLINMLRSIRFNDDNSAYFIDLDLPENLRLKGLENFVKNSLKPNKPENSLFENTLFAFFGDHGMSDTKHQMAHLDPDLSKRDPYRAEGSSTETLIEYLNRKLGLETPNSDTQTSANAIIGIDYQTLPFELSTPYKTAEVQKQYGAVGAAEDWSNQFINKLVPMAKDQIYKNNPWYLLLSPVVDHKFYKSIDSVRETAVNMLTQLYLKGDDDYLAVEKNFKRQFLKQHVRLIYGGAALNNAELLIPHSAENGEVSWQERPTFNEIIRYKPTAHGTTLLKTLQGLPSIGLIFIRKTNEQFAVDTQPPQTLEILVMDRFNNQGTITVCRGSCTGQPPNEMRRLLFSYKKDPRSAQDPLQYEGHNDGSFIGTYNEWNDISVKENPYYRNVVAGIGDYLFSNNAAIGDVTLMRSQGWDFGDNAGGHGGVHREEKKTIIMFSGPGVGTQNPQTNLTASNLKSHQRYKSSRGQIVEASGSDFVNPTVVDVAPTVIKWLGYKDGDGLADFARKGFSDYLTKWVLGQKADILAHLDEVDDLQKLLNTKKMGGLKLSSFKDEFSRLFNCLPHTPPTLPDYSQSDIDGNEVVLE